MLCCVFLLAVVVVLQTLVSLQALSATFVNVRIKKKAVLSLVATKLNCRFSCVYSHLVKTFSKEIEGFLRPLRGHFLECSFVQHPINGCERDKGFLSCKQ